MSTVQHTNGSFPPFLTRKVSFYLTFISSLFNEKSIILFDLLPPKDKVSLLCESPKISYKQTVKLILILIINPTPINIWVSELLSLQTLRQCVLFSNISPAGLDVTGYQSNIIETARVFYRASFLIAFK
jgi:hypothetical protein